MCKSAAKSSDVYSLNNYLDVVCGGLFIVCIKLYLNFAALTLHKQKNNAKMNRNSLISRPIKRVIQCVLHMYWIKTG